MRSTVAMVRPMNSQVRAKAPSRDVFKIAVDPAQQLYHGVGFAPPTADLGQAGHAGFNAVAGRVTMADCLERTAADAGAGSMRPGADQRHRAH